MKILKYLAIFLILCLVFILIYNVYDFYKNRTAYNVKNKIIETFTSGFNEQKPIELENLGGVEWEQVCFISYELNGIDVSNGLDIPVRYLKIPRAAFSQVANEHYNEFKGHRYGMVFYSLRQKILVAILLKDVQSLSPSECKSAKNLVLLKQFKSEKSFLAFGQK